MPRKLTLKISSGDDFGPFGPIAVVPFEVAATRIKIEKILRIKAIAHAGLLPGRTPYARADAPVKLKPCTTFEHAGSLFL